MAAQGLPPGADAALGNALGGLVQHWQRSLPSMLVMGRCTTASTQPHPFPQETLPLVYFSGSLPPFFLSFSSSFHFFSALSPSTLLSFLASLSLWRPPASCSVVCLCQWVLSPMTGQTALGLLMPHKEPCQILQRPWFSDS